MRQTDEAIVMAGPLFQPLRGFLFGICFYPFRSVLFGRPRGWAVMWCLLVVVGILSTFGPAPGSIEGMIYTTIPIPTQLVGLTEVIVQSLLLSALLCFWVNNPDNRWVGRTLMGCFLMTILLPAMGLLFGPPPAA
jgi:hypothetical protein